MVIKFPRRDWLSWSGIDPKYGVLKIKWISVNLGVDMLLTVRNTSMRLFEVTNLKHIYNSYLKYSNQFIIGINHYINH